MANPWINQSAIKRKLSGFFSDHKQDVNSFGLTVNQTFEAFVFASVIKRYADAGWTITFEHPDKHTNSVKLKFNTRGKPNNYTFARCARGKRVIQVRHSLRVATRHHAPWMHHNANVVLDVAVIKDIELDSLKTDDHVANSELLSFGEAKHMSAFAELIAGFIGLVHEIDPDRLQQKRQVGERQRKRLHPAPFLYVSGYLNPTAQGIVETIAYRGYDIDVYDCETGALLGIDLMEFVESKPELEERATEQQPSIHVSPTTQGEETINNEERELTLIA